MKSVNLVFAMVMFFVSSQLIYAQTGIPKFKLNYPASCYRLKSMEVPVSSCLRAAEKAVRNTNVNRINIFNIKKGTHDIGGTTMTTRGYIVCVRLPKAGACNEDGATAIIIGAGKDAKLITKNLYNNFKVPVMIDCGSAGNPVR